MQNHFRCSVFLLLLLVLAACKLDFPPAKYASAQRFEKGYVVQTWQLNDDQLQRLSSWIGEHKSGWSKSYVTYFPGTHIIQITNAEGKASYINIWTSTTVVANYGESQFVQSFDTAEVQRLLSIVGAPHD
jgi:predicted small lipoprotein YifL